MKLLLDESVPRQLAKHFPPEFQTFTVARMGWAGTSNGALLELASRHSFDALITADRGIAHQQNLERLPLPVVVLHAQRTREQELQALVPQVVESLRTSPGIGIYNIPG